MGAEELIRGAEGEKPGLPHSACTPEFQGGLFVNICESRRFLRCILVRSRSSAGIIAALLIPILSGVSSLGEQAEGSI